MSSSEESDNESTKFKEWGKILSWKCCMYCSFSVLYYFRALFEKCTKNNMYTSRYIPRGERELSDSYYKACIIWVGQSLTSRPCNNILMLVSGAPILSLSICLLISWIFVYIAVAKGVKDKGLLSYFWAVLPYFILSILFVRYISAKNIILV